MARGLRALGIGKGDVCALNSETRAEFYLADLGIMTNGSVAAALYASYPPAELLATIARSGARVLFVETPKMLETLRAAPVEHFILLTGKAEGALTLHELCERGRSPAPFESETKAEDNAILYLTSGATGATSKWDRPCCPLDRTTGPSRFCPPRTSRSAS